MKIIRKNRNLLFKKKSKKTYKKISFKKKSKNQKRKYHSKSQKTKEKYYLKNQLIFFNKCGRI